jgi:thiol-disulfide isomerase/thioredoxin
MSEDPAAAAKPRRSLLTWALWGAALIGVAAFVYILVQSGAKQPEVAVGPLPEQTKPLAEKLTRPARPTPPPDYVFYNDAGKPVRIADFKGKVVLLNLWATWCAPCKVEMPTLARLAAAYQTQPVQVVALSADSADKTAEAKAFIAKNAPLRPYLAGGSNILFKFQPAVAGLPSTIIYDKKGVERARISGDADWSSKEAHAIVERLLAEKG